MKKWYMIKEYIIQLSSLKGKKKYNRKELYFGPILLKNKGKVFEEYNKRELERLSLVLKMLPKNKIIDRIKTKYMISLYNKI